MNEKLRPTQFSGTSTILPDKLKTPSLNAFTSINGEMKSQFKSSQNHPTQVPDNPNHSAPDPRTSPASFQPFSGQGNAFVTPNPATMMSPYGMNPYAMAPLQPAWNPMFHTPYWYPPNANYPGYPPFPIMSPQGSTNHSVAGASEAGRPIQHPSQPSDPKNAQLNSSSEYNKIYSYSEPEKGARRNSQSTSISRGHTPVGVAPQYPQHSSPFNAYANPPPSLSQTGMSRFIHRPQPVYPPAPLSIEYAYHQMFSQYQGMLRDWENRMSIWRQNKGRSSVGSKSNVMGSQNSHRRRHSFVTDEASSPTPSSILTQNEDESDNVQSRDDENLSVKASAAGTSGRTTPAKFMRHSVARFSPNFCLVYTDLNYKFSLLVCSSKHDKLPVLLENLPGPLYTHGGKTQKNEVKRYLTALIKKHKCSTIPEDDSSEGLTLLLNYLLCLLINNGDVEEVDIRDLLTENQDNNSTNEFENSTDLSDLNDTFISPTKTDKKVMEELRKLLLLGKCREFVEMAMSERLWGVALRFSRLMSHSLYSEVCYKFDAEHFNAVDPIQAYINVKTGSGLNVADIEEAANFDWKQHLGIILANSKDEEQRYFYCFELGKILAARGKFFAAQLCFLVGKCPFGMPNRELSRLVLIGLSPRSVEDLDFENLTKNYFSIILTMVYEYAMRNSHPEFFIPFLQYCKFFVAQKYVDCGLYESAYRFCDSIAFNVKRNPHKFDTTFISQVLELSQMLTFKLSTQKETWVRDLETVSLQSGSQSVELFSSLVDCTSSRVDKESSSGAFMATWDETLSNRQTPFASSTAVNPSKESSPLVQNYRYKDPNVVDKPAVFEFFNSWPPKDAFANVQTLGATSSDAAKNRSTNFEKHLSVGLPHQSSLVGLIDQNSAPSRPGPAVPEDEEATVMNEVYQFYPNSNSQFNSVNNYQPEVLPQAELHVENEESKRSALDKFVDETQLRLNGDLKETPQNQDANELEADFESGAVDNRSNNDSTLVNSQQFTESFPHVPPPPEEPFAYSYSSNYSTVGAPYATDYTNIYDQNLRRDSSAQNNFAPNYANILELGDPTGFYDEQEMYGVRNPEETAVRSSGSSANRSSHKSKNSHRTSEPGSASDESGETSENEDEDDDDVTTTDMTTNESSMMSSLEHSANMSQSPMQSFRKPANQGHVAGAGQNKASKFNFGGAIMNDFNASLGVVNASASKPPLTDPISYSTSHISSINTTGIGDNISTNSVYSPPMGGAANPFSRSANTNKLGQYKQYPNAFKVSETSNIPPPSFPTPQHMYEPSIALQRKDNSGPPQNFQPQSTRMAPQQVAPPVDPKTSSFYGAPDFGDANNANLIDSVEDTNFDPVIPTFFNPNSFKKPVYFQPPKMPPNPVEQPMQELDEPGVQQGT